MTANAIWRNDPLTLMFRSPLLAAAAWIMISCLPATAASQDATTPFSDIQTIVDRGTLRVALLAKDIPPFLITAEDGTPTGIDVRIARGLADRLGVATEFVRSAETTDALVEQAASGQVDIAISFITRTMARSLRVRFSRPYVNEHVSLALNRRVALQTGLQCPNAPDDLASLASGNWKIGAQRGTVFEGALRNLGLEDSMTVFEDIGSMLAAVQSGTHIAGLGGEVALRYAMKLNPGLRIKVEICKVGEQKDNIAVAIRPDAPNLKDFIDIAFDNVAIQLDANGVLRAESDWIF